MEIDIIKHSDILFRDVIRVAKIKSTAWPYPVESQLRWIIDNQKEFDYHVILRKGVDDIAYLNICPVKAFLDGEERNFWGIGNVCTKNHGLGHGQYLIESINQHIKRNNMAGLLFCKKNLVNFYLRYGWQLISKNKVHLVENIDSIYTLCYNVHPFDIIEYKGFLF